MSKSELLISAAMEWIKQNPEKQPEFSTACGLVFNENEAADDFDSAVGEFAYKNGITLHGSRVPDLYFIALDAAKRQEGE